MRTARSLILVAGLMALAAGIHAQAARPNFSGVWVMVPDKSEFGEMAKPATMTRTITHADPNLKVVTAQTGGQMGDTTLTTIFTTDGKPAKNDIQGSPMTTLGKWDGSAIVLSSILTQQGTEIGVEDRYELLEAGKTLSITRTFTTPDGKATVKIVLAKK